MTLPKPVWRVVAVVCAVGFFWLALRVEVYNVTSPPALGRLLFGPGVWQFAHPWWLSLHVWVRKIYSIVAFGIVGLSAHQALGTTRRPLTRAVLLVSMYSLAIEIAQRLVVGPEPLMESALDVVCGGIGGWLSVRIIQTLSKRRLP